MSNTIPARGTPTCNSTCRCNLTGSDVMLVCRRYLTDKHVETFIKQPVPNLPYYIYIPSI